MRIDGDTWMALIIIFVALFLVFCMLVLLCGYGGIFLFIGVMIVGGIIAFNTDVPTETNGSDDYFTDEDFLHCKVGEWISRP